MVIRSRLTSAFDVETGAEERVTVEGQASRDDTASALSSARERAQRRAEWMRLNALTESLVQLKAHDTKRATHIVTTKSETTPSCLSLALTRTPAAADYYVSDLPGLPDDARQLSLYAGHVPCATDLSTLTSSSATSDAHLWFLLVRSRHIAKAERLVIWLNGGPGCSGLEGGMLELGPLRVNDDDQRTLRVAPHAWSEYANVLFLDQPAGTGFSFVSRQYQNQVTELGPAADQVATFLRNFYTVFPEFEAMDTFLTGERSVSSTGVC